MTEYIERFWLNVNDQYTLIEQSLSNSKKFINTLLVKQSIL